MSVLKSRDSLTVEAHLGHFDDLYRADGDPWGVRASWTESYKRVVVEGALGRRKLPRGIELGCGNGITTRGLARHFQSLTAIEGSPAAAALARAEVRDLPNVIIVEQTLPVTLPQQTYDAVIASEILYYLPLRVLSSVLEMSYAALKPGGRLISTNHVRRFSDSECSLERVTLLTRRLFGFEDYSFSSGGWRLDRFRRAAER
jgi:SAM-dependent methyltransferase